jgi:hypothetical protein
MSMTADMPSSGTADSSAFCPAPGVSDAGQPSRAGQTVQRRSIHRDFLGGLSMNTVSDRFHPVRPPQRNIIYLSNLDQRVKLGLHGVFTGAQFIVKFDLWNDLQEQGDVSLAKIWMGGTAVPVLQ